MPFAEPPQQQPAVTQQPPLMEQAGPTPLRIIGGPETDRTQQDTVSRGLEGLRRDLSATITDWLRHPPSSVMRGASQETLDFLSAHVAQVADTFQRNVHMENGQLVVNQQAIQQELLQLFGTAIPREQAAEVVKQFCGLFASKVEQASIDIGHGALGRNDMEAVAAAEAIGQQIGAYRAETLHMGTTEGNNSDFLVKFCEGLTPQQIEDALRAASYAGFSATSIFTAASTLGRAIEADSQMTESSAIQALTLEVTERMRDLMTRLREDYATYETEGTPEARQAYERRLTEIAHLVGPDNAEKVRRQVETHTRETDALITDTIERQLAISAALHSNNLGVVLPAAGAVDTKRRER